MSSNIRVTQNITTTTSTASVIAINTGYCKTKFGVLKVLLSVLSLICFILLTLHLDYLVRYQRNNYVFLLLINFANFYATSLMLICCLLSLSTAALLPKMTFEFNYHFLAAILYLIAGLWSISYALDSQLESYKTASILALIIALIHSIHGYLSYRACKLH